MQGLFRGMFFCRFGGIRVMLRVYFASETAQVELKSGRVYCAYSRR